MVDVIAAIHINKWQDRMVVNKIASIYSKSDNFNNNKIVNYVSNQIKEGNLIDASIEKAPMWFTTNQLQLPQVVQTIIDANKSIAQGNFNSQEKSSINDEEYMDAVKNNNQPKLKQMVTL